MCLRRQPLCEWVPGVKMPFFYIPSWSVIDAICVHHTCQTQLTLLLSGTRSSLMRRFVPQSLASSSSAISCRWNTATWADLRLTLPLGVRSKSSLSLCVAFSLSCALCLSSCLSSPRGALCFSLGWLDGDLSCHSFLSGGLCSFLPAEGKSSATTWDGGEEQTSENIHGYMLTGVLRTKTSSKKKEKERINRSGVNCPPPWWSYPLFAGVIVAIRGVLAVGGGYRGGGGGGGGDGWGMFGTHVVVTACFGAVGLSTVVAWKHGFLVVWELSPAAFLVVLVAHQAGKVGWTTLCMESCCCVRARVCVCLGEKRKKESRKTNVKHKISNRTKTVGAHLMGQYHWNGSIFWGSNKSAATALPSLSVRTRHDISLYFAAPSHLLSALWCE